MLPRTCDGDRRRAGAASCSSGSRPAASSSGGSGAPSSGAPNVLFVLTDDMRLDDLQYMPHIQHADRRPGHDLRQRVRQRHVVLSRRVRRSCAGSTPTTPACSPTAARTAASKRRTPTTSSNRRSPPRCTTPATQPGLFGKYLNGYPNTVERRATSRPGWDTWSSSSKGNAYGEFNYTLNQNGTAGRLRPRSERLRHRRLLAAGHGLHRPGARPTARRSSPTSRCTPRTSRRRLHPRTHRAFPGLQAPRDAAYDEADVSDKPQFIQNLPLTRTAECSGRIDDLAPQAGAVAAGRRSRRRRHSSITCSQNGQLDNTYIIFTSDNGFHLGQHRHALRQADRVRDRHPPAAAGPRTGHRGGRSRAGHHGQHRSRPHHRRPRRRHADRRLPTAARSCRSSSAQRPRRRRLASGVPARALGRDRSRRRTDRAAGQLEPDDLDQGGGAPGDSGSRRPDDHRRACAPARPRQQHPGVPRAADGAVHLRRVRHRRERALRPDARIPTSCEPRGLGRARAARCAAPAARRPALLQGRHCRAAENAPLDLPS